MKREPIENVRAELRMERKLTQQLRNDVHELGLDLAGAGKAANNARAELKELRDELYKSSLALSECEKTATKFLNEVKEQRGVADYWRDMADKLGRSREEWKASCAAIHDERDAAIARAEKAEAALEALRAVAPDPPIRVKSPEPVPYPGWPCQECREDFEDGASDLRQHSVVTPGEPTCMEIAGLGPNALTPLRKWPMGRAPNIRLHYVAIHEIYQAPGTHRPTYKRIDRFKLSTSRYMASCNSAEPQAPGPGFFPEA